MEENFSNFGLFSRLKFLNNYNFPDLKENAIDKINPEKKEEKVNSGELFTFDSIKDKLEKSKFLKSLKEYDVSVEFDIKLISLAISTSNSKEMKLIEKLKCLSDNLKNSSLGNFKLLDETQTLCSQDKQNYNLDKFKEIYLKRIDDFTIDEILDKRELKELKKMISLKTIKECFLNKYNIDKYQSLDSFHFGKMILETKNLNLKIQTNHKKIELKISSEDFQLYLLNNSKSENNLECDQDPSTNGRLMIINYKNNASFNNIKQESGQFININEKIDNAKEINEISIDNSKNKDINKNDENSLNSIFRLYIDISLEKIINHILNMKKEVIEPIIQKGVEANLAYPSEKINFGLIKIELGKKEIILHDELLFYLENFCENMSIISSLNKNKKLYIKTLSELFALNSKIANNKSFGESKRENFVNNFIIKYYNSFKNFIKTKHDIFNKINPNRLFDYFAKLNFEFSSSIESLDICYPSKLLYKNFKNDNSNKFLLLKVSDVGTSFNISLSKLEILYNIQTIKLSIFDDFRERENLNDKNILNVSSNIFVFEEKYQISKIDLIKIMSLIASVKLDLNYLLNDTNYDKPISIQEKNYNSFIDICLKLDDVQMNFNQLILEIIMNINILKSKYYSNFPILKLSDYKKNIEKLFKDKNNFKQVQFSINSDYFEQFKNEIHSLKLLISPEIYNIEPNKFYESFIFTSRTHIIIYLINFNSFLFFKYKNFNDNISMREYKDNNGTTFEHFFKNENLKINIKSSSLIENNEEEIKNLFNMKNYEMEESTPFNKNDKQSIKNKIYKNEKNLINDMIEYSKNFINKICNKKIFAQFMIKNTNINIMQINENIFETYNLNSEIKNKNVIQIYPSLIRTNFENINSYLSLEILCNTNKLQLENILSLNLAISSQTAIENIYSYYKNDQNVFFEFIKSSFDENLIYNRDENNNTILKEPKALNLDINISKLIEINLNNLNNSIPKKDLFFNNNDKSLDINNEPNQILNSKNISMNNLKETKEENYLSELFNNLIDFDFRNTHKKIDLSIQKDLSLFYDSDEIFRIIRYFLEIKLSKEINKNILLPEKNNYNRNMSINNGFFYNSNNKNSSYGKNLCDFEYISNAIQLLYIHELQNLNKNSNNCYFKQQENLYQNRIFSLFDNLNFTFKFNKSDIFLINNKLDTYFSKITSKNFSFNFTSKMKPKISESKNINLFDLIEKIDLETGLKNFKITDTTNYPYYDDVDKFERFLNENQELDLLIINEPLKLNFSFLFTENSQKFIQSNGIQTNLKSEILSNFTFKFPNLIINFVYQPFKRIQRYFDYESKKFMKLIKIYNKRKYNLRNHLKFSEFSKISKFIEQVFKITSNYQNSNSITENYKKKGNSQKFYDVMDNKDVILFDLDLKIIITNCIVNLDDRFKDGDKLKFTINNLICEKKFQKYYFSQIENKYDEISLFERNSTNQLNKLEDNINLNSNEMLSKEKLNNVNLQKEFELKEKSKVKLETIKILIKKFDISIVSQTLLRSEEKSIANILEIDINLFIPYENLQKELVKKKGTKKLFESSYNSKNRMKNSKIFNESFFSKNTNQEDLDLNKDTIYFEIFLNEGLKINLMKEDINTMINIFTNNILFKDRREHIFKFTLNEDNLKSDKEKNDLNYSNLNVNLNLSETELYIKTEEDDNNHGKDYDLKFKNNDFLYLYSFEVKWQIPFISFNLVNDAKFYQYFPTEEFIDLTTELRLTNFCFLFLKKKDKSLSRVEEIKVFFDEIELFFLGEKLFTNNKLAEYNINIKNSMNKNKLENINDKNPISIEIEYIIKNSTFTFEENLKKQEKNIDFLNVENKNIDLNINDHSTTFNYKEDTLICRIKLENLHFFLRYDLILLLTCLLENMLNSNNLLKLKKKHKKFITELDLRPNQTLLEIQVKNSNFIFLSENLKNSILSKNGINNFLNLDQKVINLGVDRISLIMKISQFFETKQMDKIFFYISQFQKMKNQNIKLINKNDKNYVFISDNKIQSFQNFVSNGKKIYYCKDNELLNNKNISTNIKYYNFIDIEKDINSYLKSNFDVLVNFESIDIQLMKLAEKYNLVNSSFVDEKTNYNNFNNKKNYIMSKDKGNTISLNIRKNIILGGNQISEQARSKNEDNSIYNIELNFDVKYLEFKISFRDIVAVIDIVNYNLKFKENEEFINLLELIKSSSYCKDMDETSNSKNTQSKNLS